MSSTRKPPANRPKPAKKPAKKTPGKVVDFDAVLSTKQRLVTGDLPLVRIGGQNYTLAPTIPLAVTETFAAKAQQDENGETQMRLGDMKDMLEILFGPDQWAQIRLVIDEAAVPNLFTIVFQTYGETAGESSGSGEN